MNLNDYRKGFTLLELLIVIGILAILTTVVVLTINPAEYLKQARDTKRVVDLSNINKAVQLFDFDNTGIISTTSSTIVYVSIPDTSSTCGNLGLPTLPTGYTYNCVTSDYLNKINGTGWIPLDLTKISGGSPLSSLPVDPINTTSTRNYYTYMQGGSFELAASFESASYKQGGEKDKTSTDKGAYTDLYEVGTNTTLLPIDYGDSSLVGYWNFDELEGNIAYDYSGNNNNGTLMNNPTRIDSTNCKIKNCLNFNGVNGYIAVPNNASLELRTGMTVSLWTKQAGVIDNTTQRTLFGKNGENLFSISYGQIRLTIYAQNDPGGCSVGYCQAMSGTILSPDVWYHLVGTFDGKNIKVYENGVLKNTISWRTDIFNSASPPSIAGNIWGFSQGVIDEIRVYDRALSSVEISAMYNSVK